MWVLGKAHEEGRETITVARGAVQGKPRHDLLKDAITTMLACGLADRAGAWVESAEVSSFRGIVAERGGKRRRCDTRGVVQVVSRASLACGVARRFENCGAGTWRVAR